jgi:DNA-binding NarL/FixJ family response regulator
LTGPPVPVAAPDDLQTGASPPLRVLVIEDHRLFADLMRWTVERLGMSVVGMAATEPEALAMADAERPDLVLVDIGLPGADGLVVGKEIHRRLPAAKVVAVTALDDPATARKAMTMGFRGYLSKDLPALQFAASIQAIVEGRAIFPRLGVAPARRARTNGGSPGGPRHLTRREREVLLLLTEGLRGTEIATRLSISPRTVRTYVQSILHKLQVHSRLEAVAVALEAGLVDGMRRP